MTNVLFTGVTGYIADDSGGTVLHKFAADPRKYSPAKLFCLVRNDAAAAKVKEMGATAVVGDLDNQAVLEKAILDNNDTTNWVRQSYLLNALAKVESSVPKHYITIAGADSFGPATGWPRDDAVNDLEDLYAQEVACPVQYERRTVGTNIHNFAGEHGIASYIVFAPMVYGLGLGFAHKTSIQVPGVVRAAYRNKAAHYTLPADDVSRPFLLAFKSDPQGWSIVHVEDISNLFITLLHRSLSSHPAPSGKEGGYYFAVSGFCSWKALADVTAQFMHKRGLVDSPNSSPWPGLPDRTFAAESLNCSPGYVSHIFGGLVRLHGQRGVTIGWAPQYDEEYFFTQFDKEIDPLEKNGFAFEAKKILKHDELHGEQKH